MYSVRLRFGEIAHHIALDIFDTQWFAGRRKKNFSTNPLAIAEREDGGATFGGGEWVVIHIVDLVICVCCCTTAGILSRLQPRWLLAVWHLEETQAIALSPVVMS